MDLGKIEDMVANNVLIHAKSAIDSRKKWVKKLRFPDDSICGQMQQELVAKLLKTRTYKDDDDDKHEFQQTCQIEPIGNKLFNEYCAKGPSDFKHAADFLSAVREYELSPFCERENLIVSISSTYLEQNGSKCLKCLSDEAKATLISTERAENADGISELASKPVQNMLKGSVLSESIRQSLDVCKYDVTTYMAKEVFPKYKDSEEFRMYLKWKYLEKQPANDNCFTSFRLLGRGGFGEVYAYQENLTGTMFACKKIDKKRMKMKKAENTVLIEKLVLEKVNSSFVVTLYYAYQSKNELNLVMTLLSGGDLKFHIYETDRKNRGVNPERCKIYSAQITLAMEHLHKENILYRDMKPENVLLDNRGNCRVADLGLAHILEEDQQIAGRAGTVGYMSPEMLNNQQYAYGVDWFALGCTIYEMCEGRGPFVVRDKSKRKMNQEQTIEKTKHDKETYKRSHAPELIDLIGLLLEKSVEQRLAGDFKSAQPIMDHPYFGDIHWDRLEAGLIEPPFVPSDDEVLASDAQGVKLNEEDKEFFDKFSTGRNPVPWQQEILDSGVYEEIMEQHKSGTGPKFNSEQNEKRSKVCIIL